MLKKSTLLFVSIFFLLFVCSSDSYADHKKNPNAGHGSDRGGNSNEFQVHLSGAFVFDPPVVVVESNPNGTTLRSSTNVTMTRPDNGLLGTTWDVVFAACPVLRGPQVDEIFVPAADWRININTQEVQDIHLVFNDIRFDSPPYAVPAELNLQLVADDLDFLNEELPISIPLDRFAIWGSTQNGIHPRERCGINIMFFEDMSLAPPMLSICAVGEPCPPG